MIFKKRSNQPHSESPVEHGPLWGRLPSSELLTGPRWRLAPLQAGGHLATQTGYLHPIWPDGLPVLGWAHWGSPHGAGGGPRALLSDGALGGSSAQHGIVLIQEGCGLVHHRQLWLFRPALRADIAPIQGELRAVLHP